LKFAPYRITWLKEMMGWCHGNADKHSDRLSSS
jgi:hypothetical protein